jgi:flagellar biosynthesis protein FlhA
MNQRFNWGMLLKHNDIIFAIGISLIIGMLLLPMPSLMLDILLTLNLALSITIMMVTIYTNEPLQYSTFPMILLVSTLFRLGLNVSATRLILTQGEAGEVIHAFGSFVVGGNYFVGIMIFAILVIINFIVITNGAGRVAEVAARFTLDAMPGKQLSIDAELNAGLINEQEAKERRSVIQKEADFYGTMDGASKFVKGDAIAGIIIVIINIIGGLIVGVFQQGLPIEEAVQRFTILTIGDGLISQMPALIISAATGMLVTRVTGKDHNLGDDLHSQMFTNPKVMGIVGALIGGLSLIPGLPKLPFMAVAALAIGTSYMLVQENKKKAAAIEEQKRQEKVQEKVKKPGSTQSVMELLQVEPMEVEIGYRLVPLLEAESGGDLLDRIAQIRRQVALELGMLLPSVRVRDNLQLPPNRYNIKLRGVIIESGEVRSEMWLAMNTDGTSEKIKGIATKEPAFGLPAFWIYTDQREEAEMKGYTVVSASAVVATHLSEVVKKYAPDIISRQDVQGLLDHLKKTAESLVEDLIPDQLTLSELHVILQNLLRERISIRDLSSILEALSYHSRVSKDKDYLTEQSRMALSRSICKQYQDAATGELPVITLSPEVEETLAAGLTENGELLALSPVFTQGLLTSINREIEQVLSTQGIQPVLLCNSKVRLPLRRLIERMLPQIGVLSYNEIGLTVKAAAVGMVDVEMQQAMV